VAASDVARSLVSYSGSPNGTFPPSAPKSSATVRSLVSYSGSPDGNGELGNDSKDSGVPGTRYSSIPANAAAAAAVVLVLPTCKYASSASSNELEDFVLGGAVGAWSAESDGLSGVPGTKYMSTAVL